MASEVEISFLTNMQNHSYSVSHMSSKIKRLNCFMQSSVLLNTLSLTSRRMIYMMHDLDKYIWVCTVEETTAWDEVYLLNIGSSKFYLNWKT